MNASRRHSWICVTAIVVVTFAFNGRLSGQTDALKSSGGASDPATQWSVRVERINPANLDLAPSFQVAIYENLLEELNKTKRFKQVIRDGDRKGIEIPNLLVLRTTVVKYVPGSETRRAVTTVSGATKLKVRIELFSPEGEIVFEHTVNGNVRFFGSNLRATHNLAHNIANEIKKSSWSVSERPTTTLTGQL